MKFIDFEHMKKTRKKYLSYLCSALKTENQRSWHMTKAEKAEVLEQVDKFLGIQ